MPDQKRVIVVGATGLVGKALTKALVERGYAVVVFSRRPDAARERLSGASDYVAWQPAEQGAWATAIDGAYAVINLAGASINGRWTPSYKQKILDSRVVGTRGLVTAMAQAVSKPQVFVCASAVGYYGFSDATRLDEQSPPGSDFLAQVCEAWEAEAAKAEALGIRTAMVRTGMILDLDEGALPKLLPPFKLGIGGRMGSGRQYWSWIHSADVIGIYLLALEDARVRGPINATAPTPETNAAFAKALGKALRRPSLIPTLALTFKLMLGEMGDALVLKGQRVLPEKALELGYQFQYPELLPALKAILLSSS